MKALREERWGQWVLVLIILGVAGLMGGCGDDGSPVVLPVTGDGGPGADREPGVDPSCVDTDGDGYGTGAACLGSDCDDLDPQVNVICGVDPTCMGPHDANCPCAEEGATIECYSGPVALKGVGICRQGAQTCRVGFWSPCEGEVLPVLEACDGLDNDCDGLADDNLIGCNGQAPNCADPNAPGCACAAGASQACYSGSVALRGVGACVEGVQACLNGVWGACMGEGLPSGETCDSVDNDCDGQVDEGFPAGCGGPPPTCTDNDGDGYGLGAACLGTDCDDADPSRNVDCFVNPDCLVPGTPGCPCGAGETLSCQTGNQASVGVCRGGTQTCRVGFWSPCEGEVFPSAEICDLLDNDCDGQVDEDFPAGCQVQPTCTDMDGDGYGVGGACLGPDCDDNNGAVHEGCQLDCTVMGTEGCPCNPGQSLGCFAGDPSLVGVGPCVEGTRSCQNGLWGPCLGEVLPSAEICDDLDNDCNGAVDDSPECVTVNTFGPGGDSPFIPPDPSNSEGVELNGLGALMLGQSQVEETFIWISNSQEGTVSKLDSRSGNEMGRYISALALDGLPDPTRTCSGGGNCPSRTAVDLKGNVWVANRAHGVSPHLQGSVTKIANDLTDCTDRNGDGNISTSQDLDGDGRINLGDPGEYLGVNDECIMFTVPVGNVAGIPRALGICVKSDPYNLSWGNPWVGMYNDMMVAELDNDTGEILQQVPIPLHPYGAVCDKSGTLWVTHVGSSGCEGIVSVNSETGEVGPLVQTPQPAGCGSRGCYGISLDSESRVWLGGYPCEAAFRYDPRDNSMITVNTPGRGVGRGISVDKNGMVWLAHSWLPSGTRVANITGFPMSGEGPHVNVDIPGGSCTIGSGIDNDGNVWVVNQDTDNASRYNPQTGDVQNFPVGDGPYTYSDFTGYTLRNFTAPSGWYSQLVEGGCADGPDRWLEISWEAYVPMGSQVFVQVRSALLQEQLASKDWSEPLMASPADLTSVSPGNFLEVRVTLRSEDLITTPTFSGMEVISECL